MPISVVSAHDRPDLVETTERWRWNEWSRGKEPFEAALERARTATALRLDMPQSFVLLEDGQPLGTASITAHDLVERPELTPWLGGVYVVPQARGRGYGTQLVRAVEQEARRQQIPALWLYTNTAERLYVRLGWCTVEHFTYHGTPSVLMRRNLQA